uniref:Reverse transcriptase domain-containing protein n=1 Tax=Sparus aurata TaxID=8175 RepID=A0A671TV44_SPAAU
MKTAGRALERRYKASELSVHKQAYQEHQRAYSKSLREVRSQFYSNIIKGNPGNSKKLFSTINHLLKPQTAPHIETTEEHCNNFMAFFSSKIDSIHAVLSGCLSTLPILTVDPQSAISEPLHCFPEVSQQEVEDIIRRMKPSTCALDPFPTILMKTNISIISPLITTVRPQSIQAGYVPPALKTAIIRPILKKPSLDPEILANYRPISNLPFLSKVLEKSASVRLQDYLKQNNLFERFQSGFRSAHSSETALMRVTNDLLMKADAVSPSLLIFLDLSAAFVTVDHCILLNRLHHTIGLTDTALNLFHSYLTDKTGHLSIGGARSGTHTVTCGVPQGSVLGPPVSFHCYADETQLYIKMDTRPSATLLPPSPLSTITNCLEEIKAWMKHNFLQLNSSKTEVILIGTPHQIIHNQHYVFWAGHPPLHVRH